MRLLTVTFTSLLTTPLLSVVLIVTLPFLIPLTSPSLTVAILLSLLVQVNVLSVAFSEVDELSDTVRGAGGFGSSGRK